MSKVTKLYTADAAKDPDNVLEQAIGKYESVLIIGYNKDGLLDPRASLNLKRRDLLWLIECFKHDLLFRIEDDE